MAESIEEIAALIQSLKMDYELSNEDLSKILYDIRNRITELHDYNEAAEVAAAIQRTIDEKSLVDNEKMRELDANLRQLRIKLDSSSDLAKLVEQVRTLTDNFKSGFNSVVSFANKDADAKNLLLDRMEDLEKAVKNGAMIETLRQRTDDLVKGYENFVSDSNLRHGNMVSALVDLKNKIDDYSSKNNYVFGTIDHTIADTNDKITGLESTISSNLGNVNSKLYSMGDDIQKILNDGFDHLKYLSSNMSEAMNSSSLDMKTSLEVLKANISDYTEHLKDEFDNLNNDIAGKIENGNNVSSIINNDILNSVKEVENTVNLNAGRYEDMLNEKVSNLTDFINALQETVAVFKTENNVFLSDKLSELNTKLQEISTGYEKLLISTSDELKNVSDTVSKTSEDIVNKLQDTDIEEIYVVKNELLTASSSNLNTIINKIQGITDTIADFKENTAVNLSNYLVTIKDLFNDFSLNANPIENNSEVLEKLSNLEILMSRMDIEKNDNFTHLQAMLQKNNEAINTLGTLKTVIEEHSAAKDAKLDTIEVLMNKFDMDKTNNFTQLQSMLQKNTDTIKNLSDIKEFIEEHSNDKTEKLNAISDMMAKFDLEKNNNFAQLRDILDENTKALESLNVRTGTDLGFEKLECLLRENNEEKDAKLNTLQSLVHEYKESVGKLTENIQSHSEKETSDLAELKSIINDVLPKQSSLNELSELIDKKVFEYKTSLSDEINSVKGSVSSIIEAVSALIPAGNDDSNVTLKLSELSNQLSESAQSYEHALSLLSSRLEAYVESAENISLATNTKLDNTTKEFENVYSRFENLSEQLNTLVGDSGLIEILANIRQQFNVVLEQLKAEKDGIISGVEESLNDNINGISTAIIQLRQGIDEIHDKQVENFGGLIFNLEGIRGDVSTIVANIEKNLSDQVVSLTSEFKPLEDAIKDLLEKNYAQSIEDIKQQIELSYVTLRSQLSDDILSNKAFSNVEELYKLSAGKFADLEELFKSSIFENIESINNALVNIQTLTQSNISGIESVQNAFQENLISLNNQIAESQADAKTSILQELAELKDYISKNKEIEFEELRNSIIPMFDNDELFNTIRGINKSLADKITEFKQDSDLANQDIVDILNSSKNTVDYILEVINDKFENANNNVSKIIENIESLNAKLDVIAMAIDNTEVINAVADVNEKLQNFKSEFAQNINENQERELKGITAKLDVIASLMNTDELGLDIDEIKLNLENVNSRFDSFKQYEQMINALGDKIDLIAAHSTFDYTASLDEIKHSVDKLMSEVGLVYNPEEILNTISNKIDVIAQQDDSEISIGIENIYKDVSELKENFLSTETKLENYLRAMDSTLDVLTSAHEDNQKISRNIEEVRDDISLLSNNIKNLDNKLDVIVSSDNSEILLETDDIKSSIDEVNQKLAMLTKSIDADEDSSQKEKLSEIADFTEQIKSIANTIDSKLDVVALADNEDVLSEIEVLKSSLDTSVNSNIKKNIEELKEQISNTESNLEEYSRTIDCKLDEISQFSSVHEKLENIKSDVQESLKLEELINKLNGKVDILAASDDSDVIDEIYGIKQLVEEHLETLKASVEDSSRVQKLMDALNKIDTSIVDLDFSKQAKDIKDSVISAVVSVTNEISFVEEADEIKDYVGERTNELHRLLMDVKHQLYAITNTTDDMDMYSYTLQDVESDLAKLRLVVNEFADKKSDNELVVISTNMNKMAKAMSDLRDAVVDAEVKREARNSIQEVNDQVVSISSRLNKLLLSRRELDSQILGKLDENQAIIATIDTKDFRDKFDKAMSETDKRLDYITNIINVLKTSMVYLGEWMDGTTETLSSISDRCYVSDELNRIKEQLPQKAELLDAINSNASEQIAVMNSQNEKLSEQIEINNKLSGKLSEQQEKFKQIETDIDNLQNIVENTISQNELKADELQTVLENRISKQEKRLDRIEKTLDKIITVMEASGSNFDTMDKIDKLEEKVSKLNANIEKLAAYVE